MIEWSSSTEIIFSVKNNKKNTGVAMFDHSKSYQHGYTHLTIGLSTARG